MRFRGCLNDLGDLGYLLMHPDLEKLLELKKITPALAEKINMVSPGSYCLHRSWGTGKVEKWSLAKKMVLIHFEDKKNHTMGLELSLKALTPLDSEHFFAHRYERFDELQVLAKSDPLELLRIVIRGHKGRLKPEELEESLKGILPDSKPFKSWWEKTKTLARSNTEFIVPSRKGDFLELRDAKLSKAEALIVDYTNAKDLKAKVRVLETVQAEVLAKEIEKALELFALVETNIMEGGKLAYQQLLELAVLRDALIIELKEMSSCYPESVRSLEQVMTDFEGGIHLYKSVAAIPGTRQKKIYEALPSAYADKWLEQALTIFDKAGTRAVAEIAKYLVQSPEAEAFYKHLREGVTRHNLHTDALIWISRERKSAAKPVFGLPLASAILAHLEKDHSEDTNSGVLRLKNYLMDTKELIGDLLRSGDINDIRRFSKALLNSPALPDLDKKSLFARIITIYPEVHELILQNETQERSETLVVSWPSLRRKNEELEDIINVQIPQNTKDISIARSYGDLRENFEYKSSKQHQSYLMHRKAEIEREIGIARGTDFSGVDDSAINIGTIADMKDDNGNEITYKVLGAWDSDPEAYIVSYKSAIGGKLLGAKVGDTVDLSIDDSTPPKHFTILGIRAVEPLQ